MNWHELYLQEINRKRSVTEYIEDKIYYKKNFINLIKRFSLNKKIIEAGCGTGVISIYFAALGFDVTAIDIDSQMLELSNKLASAYNKTNKPKYIKKSIFDLDFEEKEYDVSFSNGVLEHFNNQDITDTLNQQMRIAKYVVFGIPTRYFNPEEAMYGDERYLKLSYWRKLIKDSGGRIICEKSMHFTGLKNRILNFKKYFKPYPFRIFVITKGE